MEEQLAQPLLYKTDVEGWLRVPDLLQERTWFFPPNSPFPTGTGFG
jgi:hypothetical protein